jgi:hypothetical protein
MSAPSPILIDSLQRVIAFQDSALARAAAKADSIWVVRPVTSFWDRPLLQALIGALLGAIVGGALAIRAAQVGAERTRILEDGARQAADRVARNSLVEQLVLILHGTQTIGVSLPNSQAENRSASAIIAELLCLWEPFDSMGSELFRLGRVDLQRDLFQLRMKIRIVGNELLRAEERFADAQKLVDSGTERARHQWEQARTLVARLRESIKADGLSIAEEAAALVARLRSAHP